MVASGSQDTMATMYLLQRLLRKRWWFGLLILAAKAICPGAKAFNTRDYAVEVSTTMQESPPRITLNWRNNGDGLQVLVQKKLKNASQWDSGVLLPSSATSYVDTSVTPGVAYEYSITKSPVPSFAVAGYIFAGIRAPLIENRGKLILIVDNTYAADLSTELARLQEDLIGDGWAVVRHDLARTANASSIKNLIQNDYWLDPSNTRAVLLFGHVAVPYSGDYNADDHADHTGAWVADTYYGDVAGSWTDSSVHDTRATRTANDNIVGDGKFDQSYIPSDLSLEVGRIDFANLPAFSPRTEKDLLRAYLNKNHNFRHGILTAQRRGLIFDGFGESGGEAYAASGWRNFPQFFGTTPDTVEWDGFFPAISNQSYLWSYVAGGGDSNYKDCYGVGSTANFAATNIKTVFMMIFGSYWGDWDATDDFMRAALGSGDALTAAWAGRPHWFFHHMALGETIGYSTRITQNNSGLYQPTYFARQVHVSLLGDPTLRMHVVTPPSVLTATTNNGSVTLSWAASTDSNLLGYHVYRSSSATGPFVRVTTNAPVTNLTFTDSPQAGSYTYMIRALKLETSGSGTYTNSSQGIFKTVNVPIVPVSPVILSNLRLSANQSVVRCSGQIGQRFVLERSTNLVQWVSVSTNQLNSSSMDITDSQVMSVPRRFYRTRSIAN